MINFDVLQKAKKISVTYTREEIDGKFVKQFRKDNELTQVALANLMGVKKKTVEKWEQGINPVSGSSAVLFTLLSENPELIKTLRKVDVIINNRDEDFKVVKEELVCIKGNTGEQSFFDNNFDNRYVAQKTTKQKIKIPALVGYWFRGIRWQKI